jgi:hypothetical protein
MPPFSYEAMRGARTTASVFRPSSPIFSGANNPFTAAEPSTSGGDNGALSPDISTGIDPQLENMFANSMASPQHAYHQPPKPSPDPTANLSQDDGAMELFGSLTNGENGENEFTFAEPASDYHGDANLIENGEYDMPTRQLSTTPS